MIDASVIEKDTVFNVNRIFAPWAYFNCSRLPINVNKYPHANSSPFSLSGLSAINDHDIRMGGVIYGAHRCRPRGRSAPSSARGTGAAWSPLPRAALPRRQHQARASLVTFARHAGAGRLASSKWIRPALHVIDPGLSLGGRAKPYELLAAHNNLNGDVLRRGRQAHAQKMAGASSPATANFTAETLRQPRPWGRISNLRSLSQRSQSLPRERNCRSGRTRRSRKA
jgi:hypothetical protein